MCCCAIFSAMDRVALDRQLIADLQTWRKAVPTVAAAVVLAPVI
jgi:hypothetical protein